MIKNHIHNPRKFSGGFSLVELIVVVAIFIIITSVVLFNQNKFSSDIGISNAAYSVALQIRQAQVYGILVRQAKQGAVNNFNTAYGIHFSKTGGTGPIGFSLFSDDSPNLIFDNGDTPINYFQLPEGNTITDVCTYDSIGVKQCFKSSGGALSSVDITFKRPEPAALISDSLSSITRKGKVDIIITSALGNKTRLIKVFSSGQISVSPTSNSATFN